MIDWITEENPKYADAYLVTWKCPEWTFSRYVGICDWDAENQRWCVETMKQYQLYSSIEITAWADVEPYRGWKETE